MMGLSSDDIRDSIYHSSVYQAVMRTSIRDPNNSNPKIWIVPDKGAAEFLAKLIPGARIVKIDAGIVEPTGKRPNRIRRYTNREKVAAYKARERAKRAEDIITHARKCFQLLTSVREVSQGRPPVHADFQNTKSDLPLCCEKPIQDSQLDAQTGDTAISFNKEDTGVSAFYESPPPITATAGGSLYSALSAVGPLGLMPTDMDADALAKFLRWCHSRSFPRKCQSGLFSAAVFDPDKPSSDGTRRGRDNIDHMGPLFVMDFENGMRPEEFAVLFPHTRLIICNSFNHRPDAPRFRVIVPLTHQLATPENYEALFDQFAMKLRDAGWSKKRSGLDWSKRSPTSLFYLPCQAKQAEYSFFHDYNGKEREVLDPQVWLGNGWVKVIPDAETSLRGEADGARGTRALVDWAAVERGDRKWEEHTLDTNKRGNPCFYEYGLDLFKAGMSYEQIEARLSVKYVHGHHPDRRKRQIKSIMKSLRRLEHRESRRASVWPSISSPLADLTLG